MRKLHLQSKKLLFTFIFLTAIAIFAVTILFLHYFPRELRSDFDRFSSEDYDSAFLSMYPLDTYLEDDFAYWRGQDTIITSHEIPNILILEAYLQKIASSSSSVNTIYLGIRPEQISGTKLAALLAKYSQYSFQVVLAYPSLEYWTTLSDAACDSQLEAYRNCLTTLVEQPTDLTNVTVYYYGGTQWVISNPHNYLNDFLTCPTTSLKIMLHLDGRYPYHVKPGSATAGVDTLAAMIAQEKLTLADYPNLSSQNIIFFGDSVIGNYNDVTSIPGVLSALTAANTYNLGLGGTRATQADAASYGLNYFINAFLNQDSTSLPDDSQIYLGLSEYIKNGAPTPDCFIINYGLNDYFEGVPIVSDAPYDIGTYTGAFRTAINTLRQAYPNAHILVITPNFTSYFNNGTDAMSDHGHILEDYAESLMLLSEEMDTELLDNFHELDINVNNHSEWLSDGCHPNEAGRFIIGQRIAAKLSSIFNQ